MMKFIKSMYFIFQHRKDELNKRKIKFLYQEAFNYYYDVLELAEAAKTNVIELPFAIEKNAKNRAMNAVLKIIADGRINECYSKRIKQLKEMGVR